MAFTCSPICGMISGALPNPYAAVLFTICQWVRPQAQSEALASLLQISFAWLTICVQSIGSLSHNPCSSDVYYRSTAYDALTFATIMTTAVYVVGLISCIACLINPRP